MKKQSSLARLWSYLKAYRFSIFLAVFLKILSAVMSVIEPFVLGLAITELTSNLLDMAKGVAGAGLNTSYIAIILVIYLLRGVLYELGSYYSNYFMTNAVQSMIQDLRREMNKKINRIPVSYFDKHQFGDCVQCSSAILLTDCQCCIYDPSSNGNGIILKSSVSYDRYFINSSDLFWS